MAQAGEKAKALPANVRTVDVGGMAFDMEASLLAGIVYRDEFRGRLEAPYKGLLDDDLMQIWRCAQPTRTVFAKVGKDGRPVVRNGRPVEADGGESVPVEVPNEDQCVDVEALCRAAWAMARAVSPAHGTPYAGGYAEFRDELLHAPAGIYGEAELYNAVVLELGGGIIFRRPGGQASSVEPDEAQD